MLIDYIASALATLLIVADPVFLSALFLGVTHGMGEKQRREVALRAWYERELAERTAWSAPGVISVEDRISVN